MEPGVVRDVLTVASGVATGAMSGLFGVGGAVISTPAIRALGAPAALAVGTTLPAIIPGAASGTARYLREGLIDWSVVAWAGPVGAVTAIAGARLAPHVPGDGHLLMLLTAALLGVSAWRMHRSAKADASAGPVVGPATGRAETDDEMLDGRPPVGPADRRPALVALAVVGGVAGLLSGLLGVGGGIVMVPGFTQWAGVSIKKAVATSLACVAIFAVPGTVTHALQHDIDWRFALLLAVGVVPGARLGAALTVRADDRRLRLLVAWFLGVMAVLYGGGELVDLLH